MALYNTSDVIPSTLSLFLVHIHLLTREFLISVPENGILFYTHYLDSNRKLRLLFPIGLSLKFSAHLRAFVHMSMYLEEGRKRTEMEKILKWDAWQEE